MAWYLVKHKENLTFILTFMHESVTESPGQILPLIIWFSCLYLYTEASRRHKTIIVKFSTSFVSAHIFVFRAKFVPCIPVRNSASLIAVVSRKAKCGNTKTDGRTDGRTGYHKPISAYEKGEVGSKLLMHAIGWHVAGVRVRAVGVEDKRWSAVSRVSGFLKGERRTTEWRRQKWWMNESKRN